MLLLARLTRHWLRRHVGDSLLLAAALTVAAASLTLGLALHGRTAAPYAHTRAVTRGPDVVAGVLPEPGASVTAAQRSGLTTLLHDSAVARSSGPFPMTWAPLRAGRIRSAAEVQGRGTGPNAVDQPKVTDGTWVRPGEAVLEQAFAEALGAHVGTVVRIGRRPFRVTGIAATAAATPYPDVCFLGCTLATPTLAAFEPGLVWLIRSDAQSLDTRTEPIGLVAHLDLRRGVDADQFVAAHTQPKSPTAPLLTSWRDIENHDEKVIRNERAILIFGGSLLSLLAIATVTVLVGARLAQDIQRVGTLKAVGATPGFLTTALLTQYLTVAVAATALGVALAWSIAPLLDAPSAGLLGSAGAASITPATVAAVLGVVVGLTMLSALPAALRAIRSSTITALAAEVTHPPRRRWALFALSTRLPVTALIGLRLVARRFRRSMLAACGIAVTVCGIVVAQLAATRLGSEHAHATGGLSDPNAARLNHVMLTVTVLLAVHSLVDIVFIASATVVDAQVSLAVVQALGASPTVKLSALAIALAVPAAFGAAVGVPCGIGLYAALNHSGASSATPVLGLVVIAAGTVAAAAALAAATAHLKARQPLAETLQTATA